MQIQRRVRDNLEYGKYDARGSQRKEQCVIPQIEQVKHQQLRFTEYELVSKLFYPFNQNIQLPVYTQGRKKKKGKEIKRKKKGKGWRNCNISYAIGELFATSYRTT